MVKIEDASILERDVQDEFESPLPQKHLDGRTIYLSRNNYGPLSIPTGIIQIADFDLSVRTKPGQIHMGAIQGEMYRAPEVILNAGYTYSADIWSLGVMVVPTLSLSSDIRRCWPPNFGSYGICSRERDSSILQPLARLMNMMINHTLVRLQLWSGLRPGIFYPEAKELPCFISLTVWQTVYKIIP
jgi:serine/threonine protein kinase